ncbi:MAG: response regulator transcription factor [Ancrocorticia sp.]
MSEQIRVLLVDDQDLIRTGFRLLLMGEPDISVVGEAKDGQAALDELARLEGACDVVLMDVRMPRMNGIDATAQIAARFPNVRVLVLTTFDLDEYAQSAITAGASGFLLKDARPTELVDAIQRVATGDAVMAPSVMKRMLEQMRANGLMGQPLVDRTDRAEPSEPYPPTVAVSPEHPRLTPSELDVLTEREREVLELIAEGLNNAEISARLFLSESTVKTHVGRVLFKLELRDRIHAVIFAKELGL